jgi:zinc D-Ala-D-Ala carboxypeptidase
VSVYACKYFTTQELACSHCGKMEFPEFFLQYLDELREEWDKPMLVSSGFRCPQHPEELKKPNGPGEHNRGAVDVLVSGTDAYYLMILATKMMWSGIGVSQKGPYASRFLHLDRGITRATAPRPAIWSY